MRKLQEKIHDIESKILVMKSQQEMKPKNQKTVINIVPDPLKTTR